MQNKPLKYSLIIVTITIIILALTNPSIKQFKEYTGNPTYEYFDMSYKCTSNWLIFSSYEFSYTISLDDWENNAEMKSKLDKMKGTYTGIFMNFYKR